MNVNIKELGNDQEQIEKIQKLLFKMIFVNHIFNEKLKNPN